MARPLPFVADPAANRALLDLIAAGVDADLDALEIIFARLGLADDHPAQGVVWLLLRQHLNVLRELRAVGLET